MHRRAVVAVCLLTFAALLGAGCGGDTVEVEPAGEPSPTDAGETPTEAEPTEAEDTPTEAEPTDAEDTPTEAEPTDAEETPTEAEPTEAEDAANPVALALADDFLEEDPGDVAYTEVEARCMGASIVETIGEERLAELGVTADGVPDFDEEPFTGDRSEAEVWASAVGECVGLEEALARGGELRGVDTDCLATEYAITDFEALLVESLLESPELIALVEDLSAAFETCGGSLISDQAIDDLQAQFGSTREEAECVLRGWADEVGVGALSVLSDGTATPEQAGLLVAVVDRCVGVDQFYLTFLTGSLGSEAAASCVVGAVGYELLRELFIADVTGADTSELEQVLQQASDGCA